MESYIRLPSCNYTGPSSFILFASAFYRICYLPMPLAMTANCDRNHLCCKVGEEVTGEYLPPYVALLELS